MTRKNGTSKSSGFGAGCYGRIIETAHAYRRDGSVPPQVEVGLAGVLRVRSVSIYYRPTSILVEAKDGSYAPESVVARELEQRGYQTACGDSSRITVSRDGKDVMVLHRSAGGFNGISVSDAARMIKTREDAGAFDMVAELFAS